MLRNKHTSTRGGTKCEGVRTDEAGVCALFVMTRGLHADYGAHNHRLSQLFVKIHWQKKYEASDQELKKLKAEMKRAGEIMTVMGRLLSNGEVSARLYE